MYRLTIMFFFIINLSIFAKVPGAILIKNKEVNSFQSTNKSVLFFEKGADMIDMLIEDSWTNFSKIKVFAIQNLGGIKSDNEIIIKIADVPFLASGRNAKLKINVNSSGNNKGEIRSYYFNISMTSSEFKELDTILNPGKFTFTYGNNLTILPDDLRYSIDMDDYSTVNRFSSLVKDYVGATNLNSLYYIPYLNIIVENDYYKEGGRKVKFVSSKINNSMKIEKINVELGQLDFHKNVRRIVDAVNAGKITNSEFVGDEIKKYYQKDVLYNAHWGSFPVKRFKSNIQLTQGSFITNTGYYALITRDNYSSATFEDWIKYLSYALGKNYIALRKYNQENKLYEVSFIPVNHDFTLTPEIRMNITLEITKNMFIEDGKEEIVLVIEKSMFGARKYHDYWTPMLEVGDWN